MVTRAKKPTKNLVPIGTHVPMAVKYTLIALAESQNKSVYEVLQELVLKATDEYGEELDALREKQPPKLPEELEDAKDNGEDLLS